VTDAVNVRRYNAAGSRRDQAGEDTPRGSPFRVDARRMVRRVGPRGVREGAPTGLYRLCAPSTSGPDDPEAGSPRKMAVVFSRVGTTLTIPELSWVVMSAAEGRNRAKVHLFRGGEHFPGGPRCSRTGQRFADWFADRQEKTQNRGRQAFEGAGQRIWFRFLARQNGSRSEGNELSSPVDAATECAARGFCGPPAAVAGPARREHPRAAVRRPSCSTHVRGADLAQDRTGSARPNFGPARCPETQAAAKHPGGSLRGLEKEGSRGCTF